MNPIFLFIVLFVLSFGVVAWLLRPTKAEKVVKAQLADIEGSRTVPEADPIVKKQQGLASSEFLDKLLRRFPGATGLSILIRQSGKELQVSTLLAISIGMAILGGWICSSFVNSVPLGWLCGFMAGALPTLLLYFIRELRFKKFDALLPEAVDLMARGLRAGHAVNSVLEMVGTEIGDPVGSEFRAMHKQQSLGLPMREAMNDLLDRIPRDDLRFLVTAFLLQRESGGNLAQILDKTGSVLRERARLRGQLRIYTAQGKLTGWILGFAPFIMFAIISTVNPEYEKPLLSEQLGLYMIYGGLGMMLTGILIIRKVIDIKV
jgi:tight adherence protein B